MKFSLRPVGQKLMQAVRQGITPRQLALTCALGVVVGLFPVFGVTTLLCLGLSILFKLNLPLIQLVNYLVAPLQLFLILPFIKVGTYIFDYPFDYNLEEIQALFQANPMILLKELGIALLLGIGVWTIVSIPVFLTIFFPLHWFFSRWPLTRYREL